MTRAHTCRGKKIVQFGHVLAQSPYKSELLTRSFVVSIGNIIYACHICGRKDIWCLFSPWFSLYKQHRHIRAKCKNMIKLRDCLAFKYINWVFDALFNVHNSNLIYNHKVRGGKMGWKIIYASLDVCVRSHARHENEFQTSKHVGSTTNIEKLGFQILVNPKLRQKFMKLGMVSWQGTHMSW